MFMLQNETVPLERKGDFQILKWNSSRIYYKVYI